MSTSYTDSDIDIMDVRELRQRIKGLQAQIEQSKKDKSEAELNHLAQNTDSFSPFADINLSALSEWVPN